MAIPSVYILVAGLSLAWVPLAAQNTEELHRFAGGWEAKFNGAVICTITLEAAEKITGTASGCNINVDADGNLVDPEAAQEPAEPAPILNAKVEGRTLSFEIRDENDEHPTKMQIELKGEGRAELRIIDAPVRIKPIPLTKRYLGARGESRHPTAPSGRGSVESTCYRAATEGSGVLPRAARPSR